MTQSHPEWLRTIAALPFSINSAFVEAPRLYLELTEADVQRLRIIADAHEAACALKVAAEYFLHNRFDGIGATLLQNAIGDFTAALKLAEQSGGERA